MRSSSCEPPDEAVLFVLAGFAPVVAGFVVEVVEVAAGFVVVVAADFFAGGVWANAGAAASARMSARRSLRFGVGDVRFNLSSRWLGGPGVRGAGEPEAASRNSGGV